jgi:hypothetical protein
MKIYLWNNVAYGYAFSENTIKLIYFWKWNPFQEAVFHRKFDQFRDFSNSFSFNTD